MPIDSVNTTQVKINQQKSVTDSDKSIETSKTEAETTKNSAIGWTTAGIALSALIIGGFLYQKKFKIKNAEEILKKALAHERDIAKINIQSIYDNTLIEAEGRKEHLIHKIKTYGLTNTTYNVEKNIAKCKQDYEIWLKKFEKLKDEYLRKQNEIYEEYLKKKKTKEELKTALKDVENEFKRKTNNYTPSDYGTSHTGSSYRSSRTYSGGTGSSGSSSTGSTSSRGSSAGGSYSGSTRSSGGSSTGSTSSRGSSAGGSYSGSTRSSGGSSTGSTSSRGSSAGGSTGSTSGFSIRDFASKTGFTEEQWKNLTGKYSWLHKDLYLRFLEISESDLLKLRNGDKKIYRALVVKWHPDRCTDGSTNTIDYAIATRRFQLIGEIFNKKY